MLGLIQVHEMCNCLNLTFNLTTVISVHRQRSKTRFEETSPFDGPGLECVYKEVRYHFIMLLGVDSEQFEVRLRVVLQQVNKKGILI